VTAPLPDLVLYGRPGCHLCEDALAALRLVLADRVRRGLSVPLVLERDIETDDAWLRRYALTIPVVTYRDRVLELATTPPKLRRFLEEALDGAPAPDGDGAP
jgi:hypothetical protein